MTPPARHGGRRTIAGIGTSMQVFLARVATQGLVILAVTMLGLGFPYSPAQVGPTLVAVGVPTVFLSAWARPTAPDPHLPADPGRLVVHAAVVTAAGGVALYAGHYTLLLEGSTTARTLLLEGFTTARMPAFVVDDLERYTGLSADDVAFAEAAATVGAQTALSTFVSYAAFLLIPFLNPPFRLFASWTAPDQDRRPALLVAVLAEAFTGGLNASWFTDSFGLTRAADPVFFTVLPMLLIRFGVLSLLYRLRSLDRVLGLGGLVDAGRRGG